MSATIYDIAKKSGVSKSTVSRVLNNQENVSDDAKQKVLKAIDDLNYQPSKLARALTSDGLDAILVIYNRPSETTFGNPFYAEAINVISIAAEKKGFDIILQTAPDSQDTIKKCKQKVKDRLVKGIILLSTPERQDFYSKLDELGVPVVTIGSLEKIYNNIYSIDTDNFVDSYRLTEHLIIQGAKRIACIHAPSNLKVTKDRINGYIQALDNYGITFDSEIILDNGYLIHHQDDKIKEILCSKNVDAVFATDHIKVLNVFLTMNKNNDCTSHGLKISGFVDSTTLVDFIPKLSFIKIPTHELGTESFNMLYKLITSPNEKINKINFIETTSNF